MYYLKSRYYDPETCRFINADDPGTLGADDTILSHNQFAYCENNPVNRTDNNGCFSFAVAAAIIGGLVGGTTQVISNIMSGNQWSDGIVGAIVGGATYNFVTVVSGGNTALAAYSSAFAESATNEIVDYALGSKKLDGDSIVNSLQKITIDTAINGTLNLSTGKQAESIIHVNYKSWFKPRTVVSCFTGKYARKMTEQTLVQALFTVVEKEMVTPFMVETA